MPLSASAIERPGARLCVALILAAGLGAYANSFTVPFQFDDLVVLVGEPSITGFHPSPASRRFLGDLSFAVSYRLFGTSTAGYHVVNLAIHLANALLVFLVALRVGRSDAGRGTWLEEHRRAVGCVAALLFVAHPLQTQAVTYIVQRYASLAAGFFLLAVVAYLTFRTTDRERPRTAAAWYALFLLASLAAFWTKENGFTLPLVVVTAEFLLFTAPARKRLLYLSPFALGAVALIAALLVVRPSAAQLDAMARVDTVMARSDYLLTQSVVVAKYLGLLLFPAGQSIDHAVPIQTSLLAPRVLSTAMLHLSLIVAALVAGRAGRRRGAPLLTIAALGVLWFYETLLVESSLIPIVDVMYEHRAYLPSAGILLVAAALLVRLPRPQWTRGKAAAAGLVVLLLCALTVLRNRVWRDDLSLWLDAAQKAPGSSRSLNNVGVAYGRRGEREVAADWFRRAMAADPSNSKAWVNLGEMLQETGRCGQAIPLFERFAALHPGYPDVFARLATCYAETGDAASAAAARERAERLEARARGAAVPHFYR